MSEKQQEMQRLYEKIRKNRENPVQIPTDLQDLIRYLALSAGIGMNQLMDGHLEYRMESPKRFRTVLTYPEGPDTRTLSLSFTVRRPLPDRAACVLDEKAYAAASDQTVRTKAETAMKQLLAGKDAAAVLLDIPKWDRLDAVNEARHRKDRIIGQMEQLLADYRLSGKAEDTKRMRHLSKKLEKQDACLKVLGLLAKQNEPWPADTLW